MFQPGAVNESALIHATMLNTCVACDLTELASAELKGPRKLVRIWPEICDFEPDLGLKRRQAKPKVHGTAPADPHTTIPNDSGPISLCFDDDAKL